MNKSKVLFILGLLLFLLSACSDCIENPVDDGQDPKGVISVIYKDPDGKDVIEAYDTDMEPAEEMTGYRVVIPQDTEYTLMFGGYDDGGVYRLRVREVVFFLGSGQDDIIVSDEDDKYVKNYPNCAKDRRILKVDVDPHDTTAVYYEFYVTDFQDNFNSVEILVIPVEDY